MRYAIEECTQNSTCAMYFDECGKGNTFFACTNGSEIKQSFCNSVLYIKPTGGNSKHVQLL